MKYLVLFILFLSCAHSYPPLDSNKKVETDKTIRGILLSKYGEYKNCYMREYYYFDESYSVSIKTSFSITKSGEVSNLTFYETKATDRFKKCFKEKLMKLQFPKVIGKAPITVKQPFNFYPKGSKGYPQIDVE